MHGTFVVICALTLRSITRYESIKIYRLKFRPENSYLFYFSIIIGKTQLDAIAKSFLETGQARPELRGGKRNQDKAVELTMKHIKRIVCFS